LIPTTTASPTSMTPSWNPTTITTPTNTTGNTPSSMQSSGQSGMQAVGGLGNPAKPFGSRR
jgi:hypothetical protein